MSFTFGYVQSKCHGVKAKQNYSRAFKSVFGKAIVNKILKMVIPPIAKNGGRHPRVNKIGNIKFPHKAPARPNIINIATVVVLEVVGNNSTTIAITALQQIPENADITDDSVNTTTVDFAKYKPRPLNPDIKPKTTKKLFN